MKKNQKTSSRSPVFRLFALLLSAMVMAGVLGAFPATAQALDVGEIVKISDARIYNPQDKATYKAGEEIPLRIYAGFIVVGGYNWIQVEIEKDGKQVYWNCYNYTETTTEYNVGSFTPTAAGTYTIRAGTTNSVVDSTPDDGSIRQVSSTRTFTVKTDAADVKSIKPKLTVAWKSKGKAEITCSNARNYTMEIYRSTTKSGKYKKIKAIKQSTFTNKGLKAANTYFYKIRLTAKEGTTTYTSPYSAVKKLDPYAKAVKKVKPAITVAWKGKGKATITCANTGGYKMEIYRSTAKTGKYKLLKTIKKATYTDTGLAANKKYYYKVRLTNKSGKKTLTSKYSAIQELESYQKTQEAPPSIISLSYTSGKGVRIEWNKHPDAGYYLVYRGTQEKGVYDTIACTGSDELTWNDKDVTAGKTYYYQILAFKGDEDFVAKSKIKPYTVPK